MANKFHKSSPPPVVHTEETVPVIKPAVLAGKPIPKEPLAAMPATAATTAAVDAVQPSPTGTEVVLMVSQNNEMQKEFGNINSDTEAKKDVDKPAIRDYDFADHTNRVGGMRQFMSDGLSRQLNCTMYLLDITKEWGVNPLGGRPVPVTYAREFPEIKVLYDTFGASPETATNEMVTKLVEFKKKLAHDHGYRYLYQTAWVVLTSDELTKQLLAEDAWKAEQKK